MKNAANHEGSNAVNYARNSAAHSSANSSTSKTLHFCLHERHRIQSKDAASIIPVPIERHKYNQASLHVYRAPIRGSNRYYYFATERQSEAAASIITHLQSANQRQQPISFQVHRAPIRTIKGTIFTNESQQVRDANQGRDFATTLERRHRSNPEQRVSAP